ncbi:hypothetical protein HDF26_003560 [Pedobacter cryoconitis]|uniref:YXWGXW repeat-containing protein n=1 Tax=Pedobacter cryoconitis TaxID=188932 RepID=A0A7W8ZL07_9SPHI|nr:YXWGXW repeat-containing protein [Pedobacter cryoconitis]MBB5635984.1 hypothetical protein [Pedobacter cryoconitis]MBB6273100.1 hypothetical protein [Pedobacter cryoconitis]
MKKIRYVTVLLSLSVMLFAASCAPSYYVASRPVEPVYVRPVAPYPNAYWVPDEWTWRNGVYIHVNGYYVRSRPNHVYVRGYWRPGRRGYAWHRGHWR